MWSNRRAPAVVAVAVVVAAWTAAVLLRVGGDDVLLVVTNLGLGTAAFAASVGCVVAARRPDGPRRTWALLAASAGSWGMGQTVWSVYQLTGAREVPFPSAADLGFLGAVPLAVAALLALPADGQNAAATARALLDGAIIGVSLFMVAAVVVLEPMLGASDGDPLLQALAVFYPLGDVVVLTTLGFALLRSRKATATPPLRIGLVAAGLAAVALADAAFTYLALDGTYYTGHPVGVVWGVGYALVLLAAVLGPPQSRAGQPVLDRHGAVVALLLPVGAVIAALVAAVSQLNRTGRLSATVLAGTGLLLTMLVAHRVLAALEQRRANDRLEGVVRQRTEQLRASERRFASLFSHSSDVVTVLDEEGRVSYQSSSLERVFGYRVDALQGERIALIDDPAEAARLAEAIASVGTTPEATTVLELSGHHADGRPCQAEVRVTNLLDEPHVRGIVLNTRDVTERRHLEDQLVHQAFHDSLTALANRSLFADRTAHALKRGHLDQRIAVLFLDLDGFKQVNDSMGHANGDLVLAQVAQRLRGCVRPADTVARLGGDEFAVLIEDATGELDAVDMADRLLAALHEPFTVAGRPVLVRCSIGVALSAWETTADDLLRDADLAMYRAKAAGADRYEVFDPAMRAALLERLQLEQDLRTAVEHGQMVLHYQPTIALNSGRVVGAEALVRWQHPTRGLVPPLTFVPLAEQTGLIVPLGRWVLRETCSQAAQWQRSGAAPPGFTVAVNLSARQLQEASLVDDVARALADSGLRAEHLMLEVTESVLMEDVEQSLAQLSRLKALGLELAMDDFGTGYSSLSYLHQFPMDVLKIDRTFVDGVGQNPADTALVETILRLSRSLRMDTVAEGIETATQHATLQRLGCPLGQGYLFSRPVPAEAFAALLADEVSPQAQPA